MGIHDLVADFEHASPPPGVEKKPPNELLRSDLF
jgi:hypothetical protein